MSAGIFVFALDLQFLLSFGLVEQTSPVFVPRADQAIGRDKCNSRLPKDGIGILRVSVLQARAVDMARLQNDKSIC